MVDTETTKNTKNDLEKRLDAIYMEYTGARNPWGSQAWISRVAGLHSTSVYRMLRGDIPDERLEAILTLVADINKLSAALRSIAEFDSAEGSLAYAALGDRATRGVLEDG